MRCSIPLWRLPDRTTVESWYPLAVAGEERTPYSLRLSLHARPLPTSAAATAVISPLSGTPRPSSWGSPASPSASSSSFAATPRMPATSPVTPTSSAILRDIGGLHASDGDAISEEGGDDGDEPPSSPASDDTDSMTAPSPPSDRIEECRLVDYFIVVGAERDRADELQAVLLDRFPRADYDDLPLPVKVEWFCFPSGVDAIPLDEPAPPPRAFCFVLVSADVRLYGTCLHVYEADGEEQLPRCLCAVSRQPYTAHIRDYLARLYLHSQRPQAVARCSVEAYVQQLTMEVPLPVPGGRAVQVSIEELSFVLQQPLPTALPQLAMPADCLLQAFDCATLLTLVQCVLLEQKLLLHSSQLSLLSAVAESLTSLIYPLRWSHVYVPLLPQQLQDYVQVPLPFIVGTSTRCADGWRQLGLLDDEELIVVDIDQGSVQGRLLRQLPRLPAAAKLLRELRQLEVGALTALDSCVSPPCATAHGNSHQDALAAARLRSVFFDWMLRLLAGYDDCLFFLDSDLPVFNKNRFLDGQADARAVPFLHRLCDTQGFAHFLEQANAGQLPAFATAYRLLARGGRRPALHASLPPALPAEAFFSLPPPPPSPSTVARAAARAAALLQLRQISQSAADGAIACAMSKLAGSTRRDYRTRRPLGLRISATPASSAIDLTHTALSSPSSGWLSSPTSLAASSSSFSSLSLSASSLAAAAASVPTAPAASGRFPLLFDSALPPLRRWKTEDLPLHVAVDSSLPVAAGIGSPVRPRRESMGGDAKEEELLRDVMTQVFMDEPLSAATLERAAAVLERTSGRALFGALLKQPGSTRALAEASFEALAYLAKAALTIANSQRDLKAAWSVVHCASEYYTERATAAAVGSGAASPAAAVGSKVYLLERVRMQAICHDLMLWEYGLAMRLEAAQQDGDVSEEDALFDTLSAQLLLMLQAGLPQRKADSFLRRACAARGADAAVVSTLRALLTNLAKAVTLSQLDDEVEASDRATFADIGGMLRSRAALQRHSYRVVDEGGGALLCLDGHDGRLVAGSATGVVTVWDTARMREAAAAAAAASAAARSPLAAGDGGGGGGAAGGGEGSGAAAAAASWASAVASPLKGSTSSPPASPSTPTTPLSPRTPPPPPSYRRLPKMHSRAVTAVLLQGDMLYSAASDGSLVGCNVVTRTISAAGTMRGHSAAISALAYGQLRLFSASHDGTAAVWAADRGEMVSQLTHGSPVLALAATADDCLLLSAALDGSVRLWDAAASRQVASMEEHDHAVRALCFYHSTAVTASNDRTARVWDVRARRSAAVLRGHSAPVTALQLGGRSDTTIVTASSDGSARVWDQRSLRTSRLTLRGHSGGITALQWDWTRIATGGDDGQVRVWDVHTGECLSTCVGQAGAVAALVFTPTFIASASWDGSVMAWFEG
eukprot:PLAT11347.1.p1 GENE.PLAT11347.1~~PLAT11347.1.p1  ORF type:complete len:1413 (-),score=578.96 PLAT11347.1:162-4400(-)